MKKKVELMTAEEEEVWAHCRLSLSTLNFSLIIISTFCLSVGLSLAFLTDIPLPFDNFVDPKYNITREKYVPGVKASLEEAVQALNHDNPLHSIYEKHRHLRYDYGSSFWNYCKMSKVPNSEYLPSLLRTMELRIDTQYWLRTSVLAIFMCKMFLSYARVRQLMIGTNNQNRFFYFLSYMIPFFEFVHLTFAVLILCLQQDQDKSLMWLMRILIPSFGISFIVYSFLYTLVDSFDSNKRERYLMHFRFFCLLSFISSVFSVQDTHMKFLALKSCHSLIPINEALLEYVCICSLIFFHLSQLYDYNDLEVLTSSTKFETISFHMDDQFEPAFIHSSLGNRFKTEYLKSVCRF